MCPGQREKCWFMTRQVGFAIISSVFSQKVCHALHNGGTKIQFSMMEPVSSSISKYSSNSSHFWSKKKEWIYAATGALQTRCCKTNLRTTRDDDDNIYRHKLNDIKWKCGFIGNKRIAGGISLSDSVYNWDKKELSIRPAISFSASEHMRAQRMHIGFNTRSGKNKFSLFILPVNGSVTGMWFKI